MSTEDQEAISGHLAERVERKRAELGLDQAPAERVGVELSEQQVLTCRCGATYRGSVLANGREQIRMPPICAACREAQAQGRLCEQADRQRGDAERAEVSRRRRLAELDPPAKYAEVTLEQFRHHGTEADKAVQMRVLSWARRYLAQWPEVADFVAFMGGFGTGKGHVAWSLALAIVNQHGARARVVKLPVLVRDLRSTWRRDSATTYEQALKAYTEPDLLIVDEVSTHAFYGEQVHQHLYDVIDARIEACRPTIVTTNESEQGLAAVIRGALFNRLQGEGGVVQFGTASWRSRDKSTERPAALAGATTPEGE